LPSLRHAVLVMAALIAVAIQSLVVQTHIHHRMAQFAPLPGIAAPASDVVPIDGATADIPGNGPHDPFPGDDPNCALCQAVAHSGAFLHSAAILAHVPAWVSVHVIVFDAVLPSLLAVSHSWQSRAPPQN
jgi:hypothetical protein